MLDMAKLLLENRKHKCSDQMDGSDAFNDIGLLLLEQWSSRSQVLALPKLRKCFQFIFTTH